MKFLRQQGNFKKRLEKKWKKPKGRHSKLREKRRGMHKMPSIGYKQSESERKSEVVIHNLQDLSSFKKGDKVRLSGKVSNKSKLAILNDCLKRGIVVSNYKKIKDRVKELTEKLEKKPKKVKKVAPKKEKAKPAKKVVVKKKAKRSASDVSAKKAKPAKKKVVVKKEESK